jgi:CCR4-NOT transcription complex subunit 7/8
MRIGASQQAGSDSLLTATTFFKMREIYFDDRIDDEEYSGKLYGLGQTFSVTNGFTDHSRGGATIAERDDRGSAGREGHNQTPGPNGGTTQQTQPVPMSINPLQGGMPTSITPAGYGPLTNGPTPYLRSMVGGGR